MRQLDIEGIGMTSQRTRDRLVARLREKGIEDQEVLRIISKVPRHLFLDEALSTRSYEDTALPIGHGQTISQPYIVARMTETLIQHENLENILEVGTGSGYQAAVLAPFVRELHTVEIIESLFRQTRELIYGLGYRNIRPHLGDGSWGWEAAAPYDAIIVTAAPEAVPEELILQLKVGGIMLIPVGTQTAAQELQRITRTSETDHRVEVLDAVSFVPLVRNQ